MYKRWHWPFSASTSEPLWWTYTQCLTHSGTHIVWYQYQIIDCDIFVGDLRWMWSKVDVPYFMIEFWNFVGLTGIYCDEIVGYPIIWLWLFSWVTMRRISLSLIYICVPSLYVFHPFIMFLSLPHFYTHTHTHTHILPIFIPVPIASLIFFTLKLKRYS